MRRAWHAGISSWDGEADINSRSIGIEIANPGHYWDYRDFPEPQVAAVIALARDIVARNRIRPERVLGHSDVAPARKQDPGEKFPWERLAAAGVGLWVAPEPITRDQPELMADALRAIRLRHRADRRERCADARRGHGVPAPFPSRARRWNFGRVDAHDVGQAPGNSCSTVTCGAASRP
jgi:hypothetical protein